MRSLFALVALVLWLATALPTTAEPVAIQSSQNRQYACFDGGYLAASCPGNRAQVFDMEHLGGGQVAFRDPVSGRYLRAGVTDTALMALGGGRIGGWERFEMTQTGGTFHLRAVQNGQYVRAGIGPDTLFGAVSPHARGWEEFRIFPVGTPSAPSLQAEHDPVVGFAGQWVLSRLYDGGGTPVSFNDRMARMNPVSVDAQGRVSFSFGCNTVNGHLLQRGALIDTDGPLVMTRMACPGPAMDIERAIARAFDDAASFDTGGQRWTLFDGARRLRMEFTRP
jgi:heat shock protein HslJ